MSASATQGGHNYRPEESGYHFVATVVLLSDCLMSHTVAYNKYVTVPVAYLRNGYCKLLREICIPYISWHIIFVKILIHST